MGKVIISDVHSELELTQIVSHIMKNHCGKDVISLGDHAKSATEEEFEFVYGEYKRLSETNRVITIEGNHDTALYGNFLKKSALEHWNRTLGKYKPKNEITAGLTYEWLSESNVIVGVDSTDPTDKVISARGYISRRLARNLKQFLARHEGCLRTVILHHHPFDNAFLTALKGADRFMDAVDGGCEELFFGHKHELYLDTSRKNYNINVIFSSNKTTEPISGNCYMITIIDDRDRNNIKLTPEFIAL